MYREAFVALDEEERLNILSEPLDEIIRMLEQNLLNKFHARLKLEIGELQQQYGLRYFCRNIRIYQVRI